MKTSNVLLNYRVERTARVGPRKTKKVTVRSGKIVVSRDLWESRTGGPTIRARIAAKHPGWAVLGYASAKVPRFTREVRAALLALINAMELGVGVGQRDARDWVLLHCSEPEAT